MGIAIMKYILVCLILLPFYVNAGMLHVMSSSTPAAACSASTNEIGNRGEGGTAQTFSSGSMYCNLATADCSGTLARAALYHDGTAADNAKVCIYDAASGVPPDANDGDILHVCSAEIASGSSAGWKYSANVGSSVVVGNYYICVIPDATHWAGLYTADSTLYYDTGFTYASPPADLVGDGSWSNVGSRTVQMYVEIE